MASEGPIINNGLKLATGVDPKWAFGLTTNPVDGVDVLWVGYAGAVYVPPVLPTSSTTLYVNDVVPMPDAWNLWNPEGGSSLMDQSSSGFTATFAAVTNSDWLGSCPVVAQEFSSAKDLSAVGQSVTVKFDVVLLDTPDTNGDDFRMVFYDTDLNASWFWGIDLGTAGSTASRMHNQISGSDTNSFVPGDYALPGLGYHSSFPGSSVGKPVSGLKTIGVTNHIEATLSRIATNEVAIYGVWGDTAGSSTGTDCYVLNETVPLYPAYMPPGGKWNSVDGFGIMIFDAQPFAPASSGRFKVSNFEVAAVSKLPVVIVVE